MAVNVGSPNGFAVGYFLAQHKRELGGKYVSKINVSKINVFKADTSAALAICLLFTIADRAGAAQADQVNEFGQAKHVAQPVVVERTEGSEHVVREHVVWYR